eukprot:GHVH01004463.1.p1 GENE.GHVH01004463.1~~GHVH01004463.1.p1  ORF type:complete len:613 (+),score=52.46 GHVH01004463.1:47-1840(+)
MRPDALSNGGLINENQQFNPISVKSVDTDYARSICKSFLSQLKAALNDDTLAHEISGIAFSTLEVIDESTRKIAKISGKSRRFKLNDRRATNKIAYHYRSDSGQSHSHQVANSPVDKYGSQHHNVYGVNDRPADVSQYSDHNRVTNPKMLYTPTMTPTIPSVNAGSHLLSPLADSPRHKRGNTVGDSFSSKDVNRQSRHHRQWSTPLGNVVEKHHVQPIPANQRPREIHSDIYCQSNDYNNRSNADALSTNDGKTKPKYHTGHKNYETDQNPLPRTFSTLEGLAPNIDLSDLEQISILTTQKGKTNLLLNPSAKEKSENQDRGMIVTLPGGYAAYGVFDGHGSEGHTVSEYVMRAFMAEITAYFVSNRTEAFIVNLTDNDVMFWMGSKFRDINSSLKSSGIPSDHSGSTATLAFALRGRVLVGYVGDSVAVMYNWESHNDGVRMLETPEHSPCAPRERQRIEEAGGSVKEVFIPNLGKTIARIEQSGLSVSRAFGDFGGTRWGVTCQPEFVKFDTKSLVSCRRRILLVIASDGIWDCVKPHEVINVVHEVPGQKLTREQLECQTEILCSTGWERRYSRDGRADDTTVLVVLIKPTVE